MKVFVATALLIASIAALDIQYEIIAGIRYTIKCPPPSPDSQPRGKRQASEIEHNCYFHADESITPAGCDGHCPLEARLKCKALNGTSAKYTCMNKPKFVSLGKYDVCDKFPNNFNNNGETGPWFNTVGSNYGCSSGTCCLWFPPNRCADIPTIRYTFLPFSDNGINHQDCLDQGAVNRTAITAAEINIGQNGQQRDVCIYQQTGEDDAGKPIEQFIQETVKFSDCEPAHSPAANCCKFTPIRRN